MNKLKDKRGETLIESLVSVLIAALAFAFLATALFRQKRSTQRPAIRIFRFGIRPSARREPADEKTTSEADATVKLTGSGTLTSSGSVKLYTYNDYHYYTAGTAGAEVSAP